jgi:hypothetical protein
MAETSTSKFLPGRVFQFESHKRIPVPNEQRGTVLDPGHPALDAIDVELDRELSAERPLMTFARRDGRS